MTPSKGTASTGQSVKFTARASAADALCSTPTGAANNLSYRLYTVEHADREEGSWETVVSHHRRHRTKKQS